MGNSADAKLIYGFELPYLDEDFDTFKANEDWEKSHLSEYPDDGTEHDQDKWREKRNEFLKSSDFVEIASGGYEFDSKYISTGLKVWAMDYGTQVVDIYKLASIDIKPYNENIKKFCEKNGIQYKTPYWFLVASYG